MCVCANVCVCWGVGGSGGRLCCPNPNTSPWRRYVDKKSMPNTPPVPTTHPLWLY